MWRARICSQYTLPADETARRNSNAEIPGSCFSSTFYFCVLDFGRLHQNWTAEYKACPRWGTSFVDITEHGRTLPHFHWNGRRLYLNDRICVPVSLCSAVVQSFHNRCHFGVDKTVAGISRKYDVSELNRIAKDVCGQCLVCQACKSRNQKPLGLLQSLPIPFSIFDSVSLDFLELPRVTFKGLPFDYVFVVVCRLTSFVVLIPTTKAMLTASVCADLLLNRVFAYFGFPRQIVSDRDPRFTSEWWRTVCHMCGVRHAYTTAYHPQANGAVERTNRRILDSLRRLLVSSPNLSWVELLPCVQFLLNDAQGVTSLSPNEAVFGRPLFFLTDDVSEPGPRSVPSAEQWVESRKQQIERLRKELSTERDRQKTTYDRSRSEANFLVGDLVWVNQSRDANKLAPRWFGPAKVTRVFSSNVLEVEVDPGKPKRLNVSLLKPYLAPVSDGDGYSMKFSVPPSLPADSEPLFQVERILDHRTLPSGVRQWLVKWRNSDQHTWEPVGSFVDVTAPWAKYNRERSIAVDCSSVQ